jgi:hypothetical protein
MAVELLPHPKYAHSSRRSLQTRKLFMNMKFSFFTEKLMWQRALHFPLELVRAYSTQQIFSLLQK